MNGPQDVFFSLKIRKILDNDDIKINAVQRQFESSDFF